MSTILSLINEYLTIIKIKIRSYRLNSPPPHWRRGTRGDILLIHGWNETWSYLLEVGNLMNSLGYTVHTIDSIGRNHSHIYVAAQKVNDYILSNNLNDLILICHSKGGMVAKAVIDRYPAGANIKQAITIATPFNGSKWGYLRIWSLADLIPGSEFILSFNENKQNQKITSIRVRVDNHVIPFDSPILPNAHNIELPIVGHTSVLESEELMKTLERLVRPPR